MPELPEVETVVRGLNDSRLCGCKILNVKIGWPRTIANHSVTTFNDKIRDRVITSVIRRGKYIVITLDNQARLFIHLRMTGKLLIKPAAFNPGQHDHVVFTLHDKRRLVFNDTRKFGRITLIECEDCPTDKLGPEPLSRNFTPALFRVALHCKKRQLKPLLLDQSFVAGLGNIYVDEALWQARLHPERIAGSLSNAECDALHRAIRAVLKKGIKNCGTTLGGGSSNFYSVAGNKGHNADHLNVFRRTGEPCPACGSTIIRIIVGQRSTHLCPACQKKSGVPSADQI